MLLDTAEKDLHHLIFECIIVFLKGFTIIETHTHTHTYIFLETVMLR